MIEKLKNLEEQASMLEPENKIRKSWAEQAFDYADKYINNLESAKAFYANTERESSASDFEISEKGESFSSLVKTTDKTIDPSGINAASGFHFGYIPGGGLYPSALGDFMADVSNRYAGVYFAAPRAVELENSLIRWMCNLMGYPETAAGNLTSGGSIANLTALVTAREAHGLKAHDFHKSVIYASRQAHHSLQKAIRISGMREAQLRYIPLDETLRMDTVILESTIEADLQKGLIPFYINASLGTTNTGAIDPIEKMTQIAAKHCLWLHVDAAYGGFFKLVPQMQSHFAGIENADSITLDPHKTLFLPYGSGAVLIRDRMQMYRAHRYAADYMQDTEVADAEMSPADLSPELTKPFRGMRMWLPLKVFGIAPFRAALEEKLLLAQYAHDKLKSIPGMEVGSRPQLSVTLFRYRPESGNANAFNKTLTEKIQADGRVFLSSTTIDGIFWIRIAVVVFRSHRHHIDSCIEVVKEIIDQLEEE